MAGTKTNAFPVRYVVAGSKEAAVAAADVLARFVAPFNCRLTAVKANAGGAGNGAGNTVLDIQVNGVSIYAAAAEKPTIATAATGEFTNLNVPKGIHAGDVITIIVESIPAVAGHTLVCASAALELA